MNKDYQSFTTLDDAQLIANISKLTESNRNEKTFIDYGLQTNRPHFVIIQRAFQLGCIQYNEFPHLLLSHRRNGWRSDEIDALINHSGLNRKIVAKVLGRSLNSVNKQIFEFRLSNANNDYEWSHHDLTLLNDTVGSEALHTICQFLGRAAIDVKHKTIELSLAAPGVFTQFTGRLPKLQSKISHHSFQAATN